MRSAFVWIASLVVGIIASACMLVAFVLVAIWGVVSVVHQALVKHEPRAKRREPSFTETSR